MISFDARGNVIPDANLERELALECGGDRDHEGEGPAERRAALRVLEGARLDLERGALHPAKVLERVEAPLRALEARGPVDPVPDLAAVCGGMPGKYKRIPTWCEPLDLLTSGGLQTGRVVVLGGPPGAAKSSWTLAMTFEMATRGTVGPAGEAPVIGAYVACDEPRDGMLSRVGQMFGIARSALDDEDVKVSGPAWGAVAAKLASVPNFLLYDPRADRGAQYIEDVVASAAASAKARSARLVIAIDSIQVAPFRSDLRGTGKAASDRELLEGRIDAVRALADRYGACIIVISEFNRAAYRADAEADLSAFKGTGKFEYSGDVALTLKRVKGERFVVEVTPLKNRLGSELTRFRLRMTARCRFEAEAMPDDDQAPDDDDAKAAKAEAEDARVDEMAEKILTALVKACAKGRELTSRDELSDLVKGTQRLRVRAVTRLKSTGRIVGGAGKPYRPAPPSETPEEPGQ